MEKVEETALGKKYNECIEKKKKKKKKKKKYKKNNFIKQL